jgi:hypothetical protein
MHRGVVMAENTKTKNTFILNIRDLKIKIVSLELRREPSRI